MLLLSEQPRREQSKSGYSVTMTFFLLECFGIDKLGVAKGQSNKECVQLHCGCAAGTGFAKKHERFSGTESTACARGVSRGRLLVCLCNACVSSPPTPRLLLQVMVRENRDQGYADMCEKLSAQQRLLFNKMESGDGYPIRYGPWFERPLPWSQLVGDV